MSLRAFSRLVLATEEDAMAWRSWGFSFSRLKGLCLWWCFFGLDLSDLKDERGPCERPEAAAEEEEVLGGERCRWCDWVVVVGEEASS